MDQNAAPQARQHIEEQAVHVGARHGDVARIDEEDVAGPEVRDERRIGILQQRRDMLDREVREIGARRRIDAGDAGRKTAIRYRRGEKAGGMAGADLDDPPRLLLPHERVGGGRVEAREPVLVEAGRTRPRKDAAKVRAMRSMLASHSAKRGSAASKIGRRAG